MRVGGLILLLMPFLVAGQSTRSITASEKGIYQYISEFNEVDGLGHETPDVSDFITKLEQNESQKNSLKFCRTLFNKTRREFFRQYEQYASFRDTLIKGKYNCLTGTVLYALLLDHFDIDYSIVETNYHIFLRVSTDEGNILFEATDPLNGFVTDAQEIENRIQRFKQNVLLPIEGDNKKYYEYEVSLYKQVDLRQMTGLLHYNLSIKAYNQQNFQTSIQHLDKALDFYNSPRIAEFSSILLLSVSESKLDKSVKEDFLTRIQTVLKKQGPVMASRNYAH